MAGEPAMHFQGRLRVGLRRREQFAPHTGWSDPSRHCKVVVEHRSDGECGEELDSSLPETAPDLIPTIYDVLFLALEEALSPQWQDSAIASGIIAPVSKGVGRGSSSKQGLIEDTD